MDIKDLRKLLFVNSQYCTYYNSGENTVLAGIMRDAGYSFPTLDEKTLKNMNKIYRNFTTVLNSIVGIELILYVCFGIFPYFLVFIKMPYYAAILLLVFIPLLALFLTYAVVNKVYENYLKKNIGTFKKVKFKPSVENIDEKAFSEYMSTPRKSVFVLGAVFVLFVLFIFTPVIVESLIIHKNYKPALSLSNAYIKIVPINPEVYAQRAYAEFKLKKYELAVQDFENANKYSLSDTFDYHIVGVKTYYLDKKEMIKEFDKLIEKEKNEGLKDYLLSQKAVYLVKVGDYKDAIKIYDKILAKFEKTLDAEFNADAAYFRRSYARSKIGDIQGAKADLAIINKNCPECKFNLETTLVLKP